MLKKEDIANWMDKTQCMLYIAHAFRYWNNLTIMLHMLA